MPTADGLPPELDYVLLLFALFVVPRMLQRYRLPAAITGVALGAAAGIGLGLFTADLTVTLLATLGIVALFLFAGLEVDYVELRREARILVQHLLIGVATLVVTAVLVQVVLHLPWRPAVLVALALLTPSTGFILDSLPSLGVSDLERFWIKSKAIATELLALAVLFVTLQSTTADRLSVSALVLAGMVLLLPAVFRWFAVRVLPYAPKSEFAFLLMLAVVCAFVTRRLGVYYLVGAFVVGIAAQTFRRQLPAIASDRTLHAVELFASFFIPFYFFSAGLQLRTEDFALQAVLVGGGFLATMVPLRVALVAVHRRMALGETLQAGTRIGVAMLPTLVFTLVIAEILRDAFAVPQAIFGGLIIYTLANTLVPGFALRLPASELGVWHTPEWEATRRAEPPGS
ncbi:MAG TPA: cation:proton antiporter, partial [Gemmatimonadales bacterium]